MMGIIHQIHSNPAAFVKAYHINSRIVLANIPHVSEGQVGASITKRAVEKGILDIHLTNFRDYSFDKHHHVDDSPFGGGAGRVCRRESLRAGDVVSAAEVPSAQLGCGVVWTAMPA